jgi:hypothetical protein
MRNRKTQNICIILRVIHERVYKGRQEDGPGPGLEIYEWVLNQHASIFRTLFSPKLIFSIMWIYLKTLTNMFKPSCLEQYSSEKPPEHLKRYG